MPLNCVGKVKLYRLMWMTHHENSGTFLIKSWKCFASFTNTYTHTHTHACTLPMIIILLQWTKWSISSVAWHLLAFSSFSYREIYRLCDRYTKFDEMYTCTSEKRENMREWEWERAHTIAPLITCAVFGTRTDTLNACGMSLVVVVVVAVVVCKWNINFGFTQNRMACTTKMVLWKFVNFGFMHCMWHVYQ